MGGSETECQQGRGCTSRSQDEDAVAFGCRPTPPWQVLASRCCLDGVVGDTSAVLEPDGGSGALGFADHPWIEGER